jgi:hypothetical protein
MTLAPACRGVAVALAIAALVDPRVLLPSRQRAGIRVRVDDAAQRGRLIDRLAAAGFTDAADGEAATVTAFDDGIAALPSGTPIYALIAPGRPDVAIVGASVSRSRVARQAVAVAVTIRGRGMKGRTSDDPRPRHEGTDKPCATARRRHDRRLGDAHVGG